jgi:phage/plasmid-associated DNA primase
MTGRCFLNGGHIKHANTEASQAAGLFSHAWRYQIRLVDELFTSKLAGHNHDKQERILAELLMVLANRYDWQMFLELTGPGGSGKSAPGLAG